MYLTDEDSKMLQGSLEIMTQMYETLRALEVQRAKVDISQLDEKTRKRYSRKDKKDTRFFDIVAEDAISLGHDFFGHDALFKRVYNQSGVVITEEKGKVGSSRIEDNTPVIISDPTDRSSYLDEIIANHEATCTTMGEVFDAERARIGEAHSKVEAPNASVTLLKDNMIKYSIVLNLLTAEVFVAFAPVNHDPGVFYGNIQDIHSVDDLQQRAKFRSDETLQMLCYSEGEKYESNRQGTHLRFFHLVSSIRNPGGPNRFTYLLEGTQEVSPVGVIAHNGEKIQESLPNIAVAFFSNGELAAYKLFCDRQYTKDRGGKLLTPNIQNSIYNAGFLTNTGLKLTFLNNHDYPSEFRDTTVIVPVKNEVAMTLLAGMCVRGYALRII